jgi:hypothetical protein
VENGLGEFFQTLQKLVGQHRQLLEIVRAERENLVQADHKAIQAIIQRKQDSIELIGKTESLRIKQIAELASEWGKPAIDLSLPKLILHVQAFDPKMAEALRSSFHALTILIQRISEQNKDNQKLLQRSLENIYEMKKNILGVASGKTGTYSQSGQRVAGPTGRHLISREA